LSAGLVVERLRNLGSNLDVVVRRCILGAKQSIRLVALLNTDSKQNRSVLEWYDRHRTS